MSKLREWNDIVSSIESDKIKERVDGVSRFRAFLQVNRHHELLTAEESHSWLHTLQSLFGLVITERNASVSKPTATGAKRLEDATSLVRWTVEKVHLDCSRKAIRATFAHLVQMVAHSGKLQSFALTYLRTLRHLLQYAPHLEHLDTSQWTDIVSLCFAGVLGDKIKVGNEFKDDEAMEVDEDYLGPLGALRETDEDAQERAPRRTATQEDIELVGCIEAAFRSKSAPFPAYSRIIFTKFSRLFRQFPTETTAHLPALTALNRAFAELDLNDQRAMSDLGTKLWPHIIALWATKNAALKEQVVIALKHLLPFITSPHRHRHHNQLQLVVDTRVRPLFDAILTEPTIRWREGYELDIDHLRLGLVPTSPTEATDTPVPFCASTFRFGHDFQPKHAVAWTLLELGAECLFALYKSGEAGAGAGVLDLEPAEPPPTPEGSNRNAKRRKQIEEPVAAFVDSLRSTDPAVTSGMIVFRLQILLFLVETTWFSIHLDLRQRTLRTVIALLPHEDVQIQNWAFLVLSALAWWDLGDSDLPPSSGGSPTKRDRRTKVTPHWDQVWSLALRRLSHPAVCRSAAHVLNVLLALSRISPVLIASSLDTFARDLDVQGPNFPSDSVCLFFESALAHAGADVRLARLRLPEKTFAWLSSAWKPLDGIVRMHSIGQARPHAAPLDPHRLASLIVKLVGIHDAPVQPSEFRIPDCAVSTMAEELCETFAIRSYVDVGVVPKYLPTFDDPVGGGKGKKKKQDDLDGNALSWADGLERRISVWLERILDGLAEAGKESPEYWNGLNADMVRRHLDLATTALVVDSLFVMFKIRDSDPRTVKSATNLLELIAPVLGLAKWQPVERALLLDGLAPLLVPLAPYPPIAYPILLDPGPASDIPPKLLPTRQVDTKDQFDFDSPAFTLLRTLWTPEPTLRVLELITESLQIVLGGVSEGPPPPTPTQQQTQSSQRGLDDFGEIKVSKALAVTRSTTALSSSERAESACVAVCVRGLISLAMAASKAGRAERVQELVDAIVEAEEGDTAIVIAEHACNAVRTGILSLASSQAEQILEHLGGELLPEYRYARDERFALAALRFLECTTSLWIDPDGGDLANNARILIGWFTQALAKNTLFAWRVRVRCTAFLDAYLAIDVFQQKWDPNLVGLLTAEKEAVLPMSLLPHRLADPDFRVRFRAASSVANLFTVGHLGGADTDDLYNNAKAVLAKLNNLDLMEQWLTAFIFHANIIVVSGERRRYSYSHILAVVSAEPAFFPQVAQLLEGAAVRLAIPDGKRGLFMFYSSYLARSLNLQANRIPFNVCGFDSLGEMRQADFREYGSVLLERQDEDGFAALSHVVRMTDEQCTLECLPQVAADLVLEFNSPPNTPDNGLDVQLKRLAARAGGSEEGATSLLKSISNDVIVLIISQLWENYWTASGPHAIKTKNLSETFRSILKLDTDLNLGEPATPHVSAVAVTGGMRYWVTKHGGFGSDSTVYATVRQLLTRIEQAPFVDTALCGIVNLSFALALARDHAMTSAVLGAVAKSLVPLLARSELAKYVSSVLEWTIMIWVSILKGEPASLPDLCEALVRAAVAGSALEKDADVEDETHATVAKLRIYLSKALSDIRNNDADTVMVASLLWPWPFAEIKHYGLLELEFALASSFTPLPKFSLVKVFQDHPFPEGASSTIWRLLNAMNLAYGGPQLDECIALADLLHQLGGHIDPPSMEDRAVMARKEEGSPIRDEAGIKQAIVRELFKRLHDGGDPVLVQMAFDAIRFVFSTAPNPEDLYSPDSLPSRSLGPATYLANANLRRSHGKRVREARSLAELEYAQWMQSAQIEYAQPSWAASFAELLADVRAAGEQFYSQLVPGMVYSRPLAEDLVPPLVHSILLQEAKAGTATPARAAISEYLERLLEDPLTAHSTLTEIVSLAIYLRRHPKPVPEASLSDCDEWLEVSWTLLAQGAVKTGQPFAGLLFLELASQYDHLFKPPLDPKRDKLAQSLLYDIYALIDEPDGFYGHESSDIREALPRRYRHERRWDAALGTYGADYESPSDQLRQGVDSNITAGVVQSLAHSGFNRLAMALLQPARSDGLVSESDIPLGLNYDLAWRTDTWDIPVERSTADSSAASVYQALRQVNANRDRSALGGYIDGLLVSETWKLSGINLSTPTPDAAAVAAMLSLREVRLWAQLEIGESLDEEVAATLPIISPKFTFEHRERILSTRISLLRSIRRSEQADQIGDFASDLYVQATRTEKACLLELSSAARRVGKLQASFNAVTLAHKLEAGSDVQEELAYTLWDKGEHSDAINLLRIVEVAPERKALRLAKLGEWTSEARVTNAHETLETYFEPALLAITAEATTPESAGQVHAAFAFFADQQYQECSKVSDAMRQRLSLYKERKDTEAAEIRRQMEPLADGDPVKSQLDKALRNGDHYVIEDRKKVDEATETTNLMLWTALEQFAKALVASDEHDDHVFRFCALWMSTSTDNSIQEKIATPLLRIKTHKFVFLAYQLSARLSNAPSPFARNVRHLMVRICADHPFQTLFPVQALRSSASTPPPPPPPSKTSRARRSTTTPQSGSLGQTTQDPTSQTARSSAAEDIFSKVKKKSPLLKTRLEYFELACSAYQEWAELNLKEDENYSTGGSDVKKRRIAQGKLTIRPELLIRAKVLRFPIPVSTFDLPIVKECNYPDGSFPSIAKYDPTFSIAGGLHAPKICVCVADTGVRFMQLFKGEDDIRQDAVMEQAFTLMNRLFARDDRTRRRNLTIRTYKVIPLQNQTGVIEFVANTQSLHDLVCKPYSKYNKTITMSEARSKLIAVENRRENPDLERQKVAVFKKLLEKIPPIMRQVMYGIHKTPSLWFDMRVNFARSVATTSIVGHIVGLGDRHLNNILVDKVRGDFVAIDLGIAFDQGKRLAIPETVPFRLTQNIVDGFGMSGVDGVFRRSCEETLRVLRDRASVVMTVLEVFKHDPLQTWAVSVEMAKKVQDSEGVDEAALTSLRELPDDADRALSIVRGKLDKSLSVQYTVNQLIVQATDPVALAMIYSGWQSYV
ncbi:hypothetical protein RQP46_010596 [Phenoliferia psychrophenolica]